MLGIRRQKLADDGLSTDTPYETVEEAQRWWKGVDLPDDQKNAVARGNAIKLFKLPLEE